MKEEGLVQAVGLAMGKLDLMTKLLPDWEFDALVNHNRYTLLNRNTAEIWTRSRVPVARWKSCSR